jgi:hypothetical protein
MAKRKEQSLWICFNCPSDKGLPGKKFWSVEGKCKCGTSTKDPETSGYITKCEIIHFDVPHEVIKTNRGKRIKICDGKSIYNGTAEPFISVGDVSAVTCRKCQKTREYIKAAEKAKYVVPQESDYAIKGK